MKLSGKLFLIVLFPVSVVVSWIAAFYARVWYSARRANRALGPAAPVLMVDGLPFRDLNKNGRLDVYEDHRRPIDERVEDLLSQMTLEEKVGLMMHPMINAPKSGKLAELPSMITPQV